MLSSLSKHEFLIQDTQFLSYYNFFIGEIDIFQMWVRYRKSLFLFFLQLFNRPTIFWFLESGIYMKQYFSCKFWSLNPIITILVQFWNCVSPLPVQEFFKVRLIRFKFKIYWFIMNGYFYLKLNILSFVI